MKATLHGSHEVTLADGSYEESGKLLQLWTALSQDIRHLDFTHQLAARRYFFLV